VGVQDNYTEDNANYDREYLAMANPSKTCDKPMDKSQHSNSPPRRLPVELSSSLALISEVKKSPPSNLGWGFRRLFEGLWDSIL
jgi:hypothetical protein